MKIADKEIYVFWCKSQKRLDFYEMNNYFVDNQGNIKKGFEIVTARHCLNHF